MSLSSGQSSNYPHSVLRDFLSKAFIETNSFLSDKEKRFKLSSGRTSEYYVNCKILLSHPRYRHLIAKVIYEQIKEVLNEIDVIGGMEIGAIPIATTLADHIYRETQKEIRTFVVRKRPKPHGLELAVEGAFEKDDRALIVDDVLTTGHSTRSAIESARGVGLLVRYAVVIVDRGEEKGKGNVEKLGVKLFSILSLGDLISKAKELSHISDRSPLPA